jgi:uncharacterized membrane protein
MGSNPNTEQQIADLLDRIDGLDRRLTHNLEALEHRLAQLEKSSTALPVGSMTMPPPPPIGATRLTGPGGGPPGSAGWSDMPPVSGTPAAPRAQASLDPDWETLIRWAGIVLLALAAIFLVSTSISRGWIGPNLQLAAATLGGLTLLGGAVHFAPKLRPWAVTSGIGGAVVLPFCAAAAHEWLDLVSEDVSLVLIAVSVAVSLGVAVFTRLDEVSIVALLAGLLVPVGFGFFQVDPITQLAWWTAATAATAAALGWVRKSTLLRIVCVIAAGAVLLVGAGVSVDRGADVLSQGLGPLVLIAATMWLGPTVADRIDGHGFAWFDHWTVAVVPGYAWITVIALLSRGEESSWFDAGTIGLSMALGFLAVLGGTFRYVPRTVALAHFLGASALISVSLVAIADGPVLVVALATQATLTLVIGRVFNDEATQIGASILALSAVSLAGFGILEGIVDGGATLGEALGHLLVILLLAGAALLYRDEQMFATALGVTAWVGALGWVASVLMNLSQGQAAISLTWAIMAALAIAAGVVVRAPSVRTAGLLTLTVVIGKLLTIDLSEVEVFWRVGVFFVVGSGLLRLAYMLPRYESETATSEND